MWRPRALWRRRPVRLAVAAAAVLAILVVLGMGLADRLTGQRLLRADIDQVPQSPELMRFAVGHGREVFKQQCASCHGAGGRGDPSLGAADLADQDWLYGTGQPSEIEKTIAYGIRAHDPRGWNLAIMPAFATPRPSPTYKVDPLTPGQLNDVTDFVLYLSGQKTGDAQAVTRGAALFANKAGCYDCHAEDGAGDSAIGAPNLTDDIWLFGHGSRQEVYDSIAYGHQGVCPAFVRRISPAHLRETALYVYSLSHRPEGGPAKAP